MRARKWLAGVLLAAAVPVAMSASPPSAVGQAEQRIDELTREQERMLREIKEKLAATPDENPKKQQLQLLVNEIERRMQAEGGGRRAYITAGSNLTPQMRAHHDRTVRKIEDCGTRHLPVRDGKTVYGKGTMALTIDRTGKLLRVEIVTSSKSALVDEHIRKVVRASAPFGPLPEKIVADRAGPYASVLLVSGFEVKSSDDVEPPLLPESERCKWKG